MMRAGVIRGLELTMEIKNRRLRESRIRATGAALFEAIFQTVSLQRLNW